MSAGTPRIECCATAPTSAGRPPARPQPANVRTKGRRSRRASSATRSTCRCRPAKAMLRRWRCMPAKAWERSTPSSRPRRSLNASPPRCALPEGLLHLAQRSTLGTGAPRPRLVPRRVFAPRYRCPACAQAPERDIRELAADAHPGGQVRGERLCLGELGVGHAELQPGRAPTQVSVLARFELIDVELRRALAAVADRQLAVGIQPGRADVARAAAFLLDGAIPATAARLLQRHPQVIARRARVADGQNSLVATLAHMGRAGGASE